MDPRQVREAQGTRNAGRTPGCAFSWLLLFAHTKRSDSPQQGRNKIFNEPRAKRHCYAMPNRPLTTTYQDDFSILAGRWERFGLLLLTIGVLAYPLLATTNWVTVANLALIAIVGSVALMILTGFTGQISLGHAAFLAIGAYTTGVLGSKLGLPFWLLLPASGLMAAAGGLGWWNSSSSSSM